MSGIALVYVDFEKSETWHLQEFGNAYGGMPVIWDLLGIYYGKDPRVSDYVELVSSVSYQIDVDEAVPQSFEFILKLTDARAFVEFKDYDRLLSDLSEFFNNVPPRHEKYINHWPEITEAIKQAKADEVPALGFYSSVTDDVWKIDWDEVPEDIEAPLKKENFRNVYGDNWPEKK